MEEPKKTRTYRGRGAPLEERFTAEKKKRFLELYASEVKSVRECAEAVGVTARTVFYHARTDERFARAYERAVVENTDLLEDRMIDHVRDKGFGGNLIALFGLLRARRPEKWRDYQKVEHTGQVMLVTAEALAQARERAQQVEQAGALN